MLNVLVMKTFERSTLLALLVAGAASSAVACSKEEPKKAAWSCATAEVPMGEVVRCTSAALTSDGPPVDGTATASGGTGTTDGTSDPALDGFVNLTFPTPSDLIPASDASGTGTTGTTDGSAPDGTIVYECLAGTDNPDCPAEIGSGSGSATDGSGSATDGSGSATDGSGSAPGTDGYGAGTTGSSGSSGNGTTDGTDAQGNATPGNGGAGNGNGNAVGSGGGSATSGNGGGGPLECSYVPDLPYCSGGAGDAATGGGSTTGSSGGTTDGSTTTDCTKKNCDAPGQTKDGTANGGASSSSGGSSSGGASSSGANGTTDGTTNGGASSSGANGGASSGGASSSGGSGSSAGGGKGTSGRDHHWVCKKDKKGNKACQSVPTCAKGTHPSACGACVEDGASETDCVPQSAGGCWVTGGGFVVAPNMVSGAAADGHDNFGGNAKPMKDGSIKGHWNHVDHGTGNHAKGRPSYIYCRHVDEPGPGGPGAKKGFTMNQVYFGGPAEWRDAATGAWGEGYWFDVVAKDHGEPGSQPKAKNGFMPDTYHFSIRLVDDPTNNASGTKIYETAGTLQGGNVQLHPPNGGHPAVQSTLPAWVSLEP